MLSHSKSTSNIGIVPILVDQFNDIIELKANVLQREIESFEAQKCGNCASHSLPHGIKIAEKNGIYADDAHAPIGGSDYHDHHHHHHHNELSSANETDHNSILARQLSRLSLSSLPESSIYRRHYSIPHHQQHNNNDNNPRHKQRPFVDSGEAAIFPKLRRSRSQKCFDRKMNRVRAKAIKNTIAEIAETVPDVAVDQYSRKQGTEQSTATSAAAATTTTTTDLQTIVDRIARIRKEYQLFSGGDNNNNNNTNIDNNNNNNTNIDNNNNYNNNNNDDDNCCHGDVDSGDSVDDHAKNNNLAKIKISKSNSSIDVAESKWRNSKNSKSKIEIENNRNKKEKEVVEEEKTEKSKTVKTEAAKAKKEEKEEEKEEQEEEKKKSDNEEWKKKKTMMKLTGVTYNVILEKLRNIYRHNFAVKTVVIDSSQSSSSSSSNSTTMISSKKSSRSPRPTPQCPCGKPFTFSDKSLQCIACLSACHTGCATLLPTPCVRFVDPQLRPSALISNYVYPRTRPSIPSLIVHCCAQIEMKCAETAATMAPDATMAPSPPPLKLYYVESERLKPVKERCARHLKSGAQRLDDCTPDYLCGMVKHFLAHICEPVFGATQWKQYAIGIHKKTEEDLRNSLLDTFDQMHVANVQTLCFMLLHLKHLIKLGHQDLDIIVDIFCPILLGDTEVRRKTRLMKTMFAFEDNVLASYVER